MLLVIIKIYSDNVNRLLVVSIFLLIFSLFAILSQTPYIVLFGGILSVLAVILAAFSWTQSNWEYVGLDDPLFPDD
ncbi:hypothetical protein LCGC14_0729000 [marine sediment metagenome]|uniref:Uncharacterized protein n=1 Tax=marine sediment metagenome TaxID=412755 RepID=A0A0F9THE7_9ZZZZ